MLGSAVALGGNQSFSDLHGDKIGTGIDIMKYIMKSM